MKRSKHRDVSSAELKEIKPYVLKETFENLKLIAGARSYGWAIDELVRREVNRRRKKMLTQEQIPPFGENALS